MAYRLKGRALANGMTMKMLFSPLFPLNVRTFYSFQTPGKAFPIMHNKLQHLAVVLEQMVLDLKMNDDRFAEQFDEAEFKLKAVSHIKLIFYFLLVEGLNKPNKKYVFRY